jgi:hypothetical protein
LAGYANKPAGFVGANHADPKYLDIGSGGLENHLFLGKDRAADRIIAFVFHETPLIFL